MQNGVVGLVEMRPASAEFVTSVAEGTAVRTHGLPCLTLVGRSNVGKSSLINALVRRRVARSGAKPGTTRLINLYRVSTAPPRRTTFLFLDLPGYGYARGGDRTRHAFDAMTAGFFGLAVPTGAPSTAATEDPALAGIILVVDVRHPGLEADVAAHQWSATQRVPVLIVATKADRMSRAGLARAKHEHAAALGRAVVAVSTRPGGDLRLVWTWLSDVLHPPVSAERARRPDPRRDG